MAVRTGAEVLVIGFLLETPPGGGRTRTRLHFVDCRPFGGRSRVAAVTAELAAFRRSARLNSVGRAAVRQLAAARRLRPLSSNTQGCTRRSSMRRGRRVASQSGLTKIEPDYVVIRRLPPPTARPAPPRRPHPRPRLDRRDRRLGA